MDEGKDQRGDFLFYESPLRKKRPKKFTGIVFLLLGIFVSLAGLEAPFDQGLNNCFYFMVGISIAVYGIVRMARPE